MVLTEAVRIGPGKRVLILAHLHEVGQAGGRERHVVRITSTGNRGVIGDVDLTIDDENTPRKGPIDVVVSTGGAGDVDTLGVLVGIQGRE